MSFPTRSGSLSAGGKSEFHLAAWNNIWPHSHLCWFKILKITVIQANQTTPVFVFDVTATSKNTLVVEKLYNISQQTVDCYYFKHKHKKKVHLQINLHEWVQANI